MSVTVDTAAAPPDIARYIGSEQYLWGLHRILDGLVQLHQTR